ncbi:MAG: diguanylate cyclase [Planctomycetota bacterium]
MSGTAERRAEPASSADGPVARLCEGLYRWLADSEGQAHLWAAFDQLVRELLSEHMGATRVRCYHVRPGLDTLQPIAHQGPSTPTKGPSARDGVLGYAVTTGREYVAAGTGQGPLLENLAAADEEPWEWVWPVRGANDLGPPGDAPPAGPVVGVVAVARLHDAARLTAGLRQTIGRLLAMAWNQVECLERLRVLRRTDPASGVLTRHDFFTLAAHALADSYRENEPVVVAVLALEGLRRLDDTGHWHQRDALIEQLGPVIARRVRSDDLVGRFADDRFVMLLRRLDSALGRLIAEKVLAAATQTVATLDGAQSPVRLRVGLAGSGLQRPALEDLLVRAFRAVEQARASKTWIGTDLSGAAEVGHE